MELRQAVPSHVLIALKKRGIVNEKVEEFLI
jgi:hypothetical protein